MTSSRGLQFVFYRQLSNNPFFKKWAIDKQFYEKAYFVSVEKFFLPAIRFRNNLNKKQIGWAVDIL